MKNIASWTFLQKTNRICGTKQISSLYILIPTQREVTFYPVPLAPVRVPFSWRKLTEVFPNINWNKGGWVNQNTHRVKVRDIYNLIINILNITTAPARETQITVLWKGRDPIHYSPTYAKKVRSLYWLPLSS